MRCTSRGLLATWRALRQSLEAYTFTTARQFSASMAAMGFLLRSEDVDAHLWAERGTALGHSVLVAPQTDIRAQLAFRAERYEEAATLLKAGCPQEVRAAGALEAIDLLCAAIPVKRLRHRAASALRTLEGRLTPADMDQITRKRLSVWYTMLGDIDAAHDLMDRALTYYAQRGFVGGAWGWLWLRELAPFRRDDRFQDFARRLGLFAYWSEYGPPDDHVIRDGRLVELTQTRKTSATN